MRPSRFKQLRADALMLPWFAPLAINRQTGPGIWKQRGTRSQTQLAHGRSRTPPTRIYTTKTRCPCSGGLLRIHSRASTSVLSFCKSLQAAACEQGQGYGSSMAQGAKPHGRSRTPPTLWWAAENAQPCVHICPFILQVASSSCVQMH